MLQDCVCESAPLKEEHGKPPFTGATHDLDLSCVPSPPQDTEHSDHSLQAPQAALTVSDPIFEEKELFLKVFCYANFNDVLICLFTMTFIFNI